MPAVRNVVKHLRVEVAQRKRKCARNRSDHKIGKGDRCLVIQDGQESSNYCISCAGEILRLAKESLVSVESELART